MGAPANKDQKLAANYTNFMNPEVEFAKFVQFAAVF
jgi:hypothetical protein